jgi:hypothetical protein
MKKNESYKRQIEVKADPKFVFRALTKEIGSWWTPSDKEISAVNDVVTFRFAPTYWTMRVEQYVQDQLLILECIEANHEDKKLPASIREEWLGTKLNWQLEKARDKTKITFIHDGLVPQLECFEICEAGWDYFFVNSLKSYIETGKGHPTKID